MTIVLDTAIEPPPAATGIDAAKVHCAEDERAGKCGGANRLYPRLAFVHVPKTAGTSVAAALMRHYQARMLPAMTTLDYRLYDDDALTRFRFYKGHAYRRDYERLPEDTVRFTILRDPVTRAKSYYAYYRALDESSIHDPFVLEASRLAKNASPIEFVYSDSPFVIEHIRLGQVRQFLPASRLAEVGHRQFLTRALRQAAVMDFVAEMKRFAFVLTKERLSLSFPLMVQSLGLPCSVAVLGWENRSAPVEDVDTADLRRALVDVNAAEFECYAHVQLHEQAWLAESLAPLLCDICVRASGEA